MWGPKRSWASVFVLFHGATETINNGENLEILACSWCRELLDVPCFRTFFAVHHVQVYCNIEISWITIDQLDVTCFIISVFTTEHVSNVSTSIFRSLRLIVDYFKCCIALVRCVSVLRCGSVGVVWYLHAGWSSASVCIRACNARQVKVMTETKWDTLVVQGEGWAWG